MEPNQLHELATNATLNHWPPHLGVVTDTDKIQYLADRLRETANELGHANSLLQKYEELGTDIDDLQANITRVQEALSEIDEMA